MRPVPGPPSADVVRQGRPARHARHRRPVPGSRALGEALLERWRAVLGPDHPDTLAAATSRTFALFSLGEATPACELGEDTLQRCLREHGPNHAGTLWAATVLTLALVGWAEAEPARALGEDTLQRCRRMHGPEHPTTLEAAGALTGALFGLGEAEPARAWPVTRCNAAAGRSGGTTRSLVT